MMCGCGMCSHLHTVEDQTERAQELRQLLTALGPTFIKFGQMLSTRPDLLPYSVLQVSSYAGLMSSMHKRYIGGYTVVVCSSVV